jgi:hypothetical protein
MNNLYSDWPEAKLGDTGGSDLAGRPYRRFVTDPYAAAGKKKNASPTIR